MPVTDTRRAGRRHAAAWLATALAALVLTLAPWPGTASAAADRTFQIEARSYAFSPAVLHANPGDRITIELQSMDYVHGLYLDGYGLNLTADPGQTARLTFTADRQAEPSASVVRSPAVRSTHS